MDEEVCRGTVSILIGNVISHTKVMRMELRFASDLLVIESLTDQGRRVASLQDVIVVIALVRRGPDTESLVSQPYSIPLR